MTLGAVTEDSSIRNYFQSSSFTTEFGVLQWPSGKCGMDFPFVKDIKFGARLHEKGQIALTIPTGGLTAFTYHYFDNSYNVFVLLMPLGEKIRSRTVVVAK